jgi:Derlin-2/3
MFFFVTIPVQWLPYAMLLITYVADGQTATIIQATGLIAAHLHDFLTNLWPRFGGGRNLLPTPNFVKRMFKFRRITEKGTYTVYTPTPKPGSSLGGIEAWRHRGPGHTLGGA